MQKGTVIAIVIVLILVVGGIWYFSSSSIQNNYYNTKTNNPSSGIQNSAGQLEQSTTTNTAPQTQTVVMTASSGLGNIIVGSNGHTLYIFKADTNGQSTCYGGCANVWPPLTVANGITPQGRGMTATLGVTQRTDSTYQVTANGMPLYYYTGDSGSGTTNGQGIIASGARWYVVSPSGQVITSSSSSSGSSGGGGYGY